MDVKRFRYLCIGLLIMFSFTTCKPKVENENSNDYALLSSRENWSHHYALGSPSWDSFERLPGNPVYRGRKGMEWPVNGFLFSDPVSSKWYLYIGEYRENYRSDIDTATRDFNCVIYSSSDKGKTWIRIGDLFESSVPAYNSHGIEVPDVMLTYANGRYHMIFDWVYNDFEWSKAEFTGIGYAVADKPEGPFVIAEDPVKINSQYKQDPLLKRYWRMYAPMIVKREKDWALLYMMDTQPPRSWVLAVSTAPNPEGPYGETKILLNVENKTNYAPLQEFYPAFINEGFVYFPATSVATNRNYQSVHRVKIEELTQADKYELYSGGSFWHGYKAENEHVGIWGQTLTAFIDNDTIYAMFPSKDEKNYGTINLAKAPWSNFFREKGFRLAAHAEKSFSFIEKMIDVESIDMEFKLDGTLHFYWDFHTPIDMLNGWGKFTLENSNARHKEIVINNAGWKINVHDSSGIKNIDSGKVENWNKTTNRLQFKKDNGKYVFYLNEEKYWEGHVNINPGLVGVALDTQSYLTVNTFKMQGNPHKGFVTYGFYEALVNSGNQDSSWTFASSPEFTYGRGAISRNDSSFAKWNFDGKGFELYLPKGPSYGTVNIYLDGKLLENLSLNAVEDIKSTLVFRSTGLKMGPHAVYIESMDGLLPVDCIKIEL